jgi:hypothetical protein
VTRRTSPSTGFQSPPRLSFSRRGWHVLPADPITSVASCEAIRGRQPILEAAPVPAERLEATGAARFARD